MKNKQAIKYYVNEDAKIVAASVSTDDIVKEFDDICADQLLYTEGYKKLNPFTPGFSSITHTNKNDTFDVSIGKYVAKAKLYQAVFKHKIRILDFLIKEHQKLIEKYYAARKRAQDIVEHFDSVRAKYMDNESAAKVQERNAKYMKSTPMAYQNKDTTDFGKSIVVKEGTMPEKSCIIKNKKFVYNPETNSYEYSKSGKGYKHDISISGTPNVMNDKERLERLLDDNDRFNEFKAFQEHFNNLNKMFNNLFNW